jgi:lactate permease
VLALIVPLILVGMVDGMRGVRQTWPAAMVGGIAFAVGQFACSNYLSVELTDIVASLLSVGALVLFLRVWQPSEPLRAEGTGFARPAMAGGATADPAFEAEARRREGGPNHRDSAREQLIAYSPYLIIIAIFAIAQWNPIKTWLADNGIVSFEWPGLDVKNPAGEEPTAATYNFNWLPAAGTLLLIAGLLTMAVLRMGPGRAIKIYGETLDQLKWATLTVATVLGLAYVMNLSGQTITIGTWIAGSGSALALLSPVLGWFGTAVTGSDTSSNALFASLQYTAAKGAGIDPTLLVAGNTSGGVVGKMISPQNLTIAATAVGCTSQESELLRATLKWSLGLLLVLCVLIYAQSGILAWTLP